MCKLELERDYYHQDVHFDDNVRQSQSCTGGMHAYEEEEDSFETHKMISHHPISPLSGYEAHEHRKYPHIVYYEPQDNDKRHAPSTFSGFGEKSFRKMPVLPRNYCSSINAPSNSRDRRSEGVMIDDRSPDCVFYKKEITNYGQRSPCIKKRSNSVTQYPRNVAPSNGRRCLPPTPVRHGKDRDAYRSCASQGDLLLYSQQNGGYCYRNTTSEILPENRRCVSTEKRRSRSPTRSIRKNATLPHNLYHDFANYDNSSDANAQPIVSREVKSRSKSIAEVYDDEEQQCQRRRGSLSASPQRSWGGEGRIQDSTKSKNKVYLSVDLDDESPSFSSLSRRSSSTSPRHIRRSVSKVERNSGRKRFCSDTGETSPVPRRLQDLEFDENELQCYQEYPRDESVDGIVFLDNNPLSGDEHTLPNNLHPVLMKKNHEQEFSIRPESKNRRSNIMQVRSGNNSTLKPNRTHSRNFRSPLSSPDFEEEDEEEEKRNSNFSNNTRGHVFAMKQSSPTHLPHHNDLKINYHHHDDDLDFA